LYICLMRNFREDNEQNRGINIFLILFIFLVFVSANNPEKHNSHSKNYNVQPELICGSITYHTFAVIFKTFHIPDIQESYYESVEDKIVNAFSFQNILSDYNRKLDQRNIVIQQEQLVIKPGLHWKIRFYPVTRGDDILPVLS
jgi:hypothetical protein